MAELATEEPARAQPADAQKDGGAVTQTKDKTPSPSRSDPNV
jgi:hypothetical protein